MKKYLIIILIGFTLNAYLDKIPGFHKSAISQADGGAGDDVLQKAYDNHSSDIQVTGMATVYRKLPDDLDGSRHQKFLVRTHTGQSILIAHNIDLSTKINSLAVGDTIEFSGEYEWGLKGGAIHWTHHDPSGRHVDGWLKHNGIIYQ